MKKIKGFEDYLITIFGNIYSLKSNKWLKSCDNNYGYLFVNLCKNKKIKPKTIHRLVANTFIPNPDNKPQVNHKDGNKQNNFIDNLEWVTCSENHKHAYKIGLKSNKGIKNPNSKLTKNDVLTIQGIYLNILNQRFIAKMYNISQIQVSRIIQGKTWKN